MGCSATPPTTRSSWTPQSRSNGSGQVLSYSDSHGLCFEVEHIEAQGALNLGTPPRRAWYNVDEIVYLIDPSSFITVAVSVNVGELKSVTIDLPAFPVDLDEAVRNL